MLYTQTTHLTWLTGEGEVLLKWVTWWKLQYIPPDCCYFIRTTVKVCSATMLPAKGFQSELFTEGNTIFERAPVCPIWKCLMLSVPCVQWFSACGQEGSSLGSRRRKYVGEKGLVWEWVGPGEKFSLRKWSVTCESKENHRCNTFHGQKKK